MGQDEIMPTGVTLGFRSPYHRHAEGLIRADQQNPHCDQEICSYHNVIRIVSTERKSRGNP